MKIRSCTFLVFHLKPFIPMNRGDLSQNAFTTQILFLLDLMPAGNFTPILLFISFMADLDLPISIPRSSKRCRQGAEIRM